MKIDLRKALLLNKIVMYVPTYYDKPTFPLGRGLQRKGRRVCGVGVYL